MHVMPNTYCDFLGLSFCQIFKKNSIFLKLYRYLTKGLIYLKLSLKFENMVGVRQLIES
jgi:hypothetical protein